MAQLCNRRLLLRGNTGGYSATSHDAVEIMRQMLNVGHPNAFDALEVYSGGDSETLIGQAIRKLRPDAQTIFAF